MKRRLQILGVISLLFLLGSIFFITQAGQNIEPHQQRNCVRVQDYFKCDDSRILRFTSTPNPFNPLLYTPRAGDDGSSDNGSQSGGENTPLPAPTIDPRTCIGATGPEDAFFCEITYYSSAVTVYNCDYPQGLLIRQDTASIGVSGAPVDGYILHGESYEVTGQVNVPNDNYDELFVTGSSDDHSYFDAANVRLDPCLNPPDLSLINCSQYQSSVDNVDQSTFEGLTAEEICDVAEQLHRYASSALLSARAQRRITGVECLEANDYTAAMMAFIDLMNTLQDMDIQTHAKLRDRLEDENLNPCNFIPQLMQNHMIVDETLQLDVAIPIMVISCNPFIDDTMVEKVTISISQYGNISSIDDINKDPDGFCNMVSTLTRMDGILFDRLDAEYEVLWSRLQQNCLMPPPQAMNAILYAKTVRVDVSKVNDALTNENTQMCNLLTGDGNAGNIEEYLIDYEDLTRDEQIEIEIIVTVIDNSECEASDAELYSLSEQFKGWLNSDSIKNSTIAQNILAASNPCVAIDTFLDNGNPPPVRDTTAVMAVIADVEANFSTDNRNELFNNGRTQLVSSTVDEIIAIIYGTDAPANDAIAILLARNNNNLSELHLISEGEWKQLDAITGQNILSVAIAEDGTTLAYFTEEDNDIKLWRYEIGSEIDPELQYEFPSTGIFETNYTLYINPQNNVGDRLVFSTTDQNVVIFTLQDQTGRRDLFRFDMALAGEEPEMLTCGLSGGGYHPDYSPTGPWILFSADVEDSDALSIQRLDEASDVFCGDLVIAIETASSLFPQDGTTCFAAVYNELPTHQLALCKIDDAVGVYAPDEYRNLIPRDWVYRDEVEPGILTSISPGPSLDFFTVFDDNDNASFIIWGFTENAEGTDDPKVAIPIDLGAGLNVQYLQWAHEDVD